MQMEPSFRNYRDMYTDKTLFYFGCSLWTITVYITLNIIKYKHIYLSLNSSSVAQQGVLLE